MISRLRVTQTVGLCITLTLVLGRTSLLPLDCDARILAATQERQEFWRDHVDQAAPALMQLSDSVTATIRADGSVKFFDAKRFGRRMRACEADAAQCGTTDESPAIDPPPEHHEAARALKALLAAGAASGDDAEALVEKCPGAKTMRVWTDLERVEMALQPPRSGAGALNRMEATCGGSGTYISGWNSRSIDGGATWMLTPTIAWCADPPGTQPSPPDTFTHAPPPGTQRP